MKQILIAGNELGEIVQAAIDTMRPYISFQSFDAALTHYKKWGSRISTIICGTSFTEEERTGIEFVKFIVEWEEAEHLTPVKKIHFTEDNEDVITLQGALSIKAATAMDVIAIAIEEDVS